MPLCTALKVERNVPLGRYTTLGIGGPARYFARCASVEDLTQAAHFAKQNFAKVLIVGKGSNLLFDDRGYQGLVVLNELTSCDDVPLPRKGIVQPTTMASTTTQQQVDDEVTLVVVDVDDVDQVDEVDGTTAKLEVKVGSGYAFNTLGQRLSTAGWGGLEFATGIPGTVGGAIYMNAGANGRETCEVLSSVEFLTRSGQVRRLELGGSGSCSSSDMGFTYRTSPFQGMDDLFAIVSGTFSVAASANAKATARAYMHRRNETQPLRDKSAGCTFRNPEQPCSPGQEQVPSAGALIDGAGLKGYSVGTAMVSPVHANYLVCTETRETSSRDMKELIRVVKDKVKAKTGIELETEVKIIKY